MYMYRYMVTLVSLGNACLWPIVPYDLLCWLFLSLELVYIEFLFSCIPFAWHRFLDIFVWHLLSGQFSRGHVFFLTFYVWRSLLHGIPCIDNLESWHSLLKFCFLGPLCFDVSLIYRHVFLWEGRLRSCWFVFSTFRNSYTHPKNKTFAHTLCLDPYTSAITMTYT